MLCVQRKLLVEKRVVLDDIPYADRKSDRLLATLPPREPTIQRDEDSPSASKLRASKSEYNMSRTKTHPAAAQQPVSRAQLATSISVGNSLSTRTGHPAVVGFPAQSDAVGSWKVHDINEVREPQNANSCYEPGRVRVSEQVPSLGRVSSAVQQRSTDIYGQQVGYGRKRTDRDQRKPSSANADSAQSSSHGSRPRSVPPKLSHQPLQVHDAQCGVDSLGAQYEPGNVRHLVQTFQSAFRPLQTVGRGDVAVDQTAEHAGPSQAADEAQQMSAPARERLQTADRQNRWPLSSQHNLHTIPPPRTDATVNVCVVRPATGRSLPQPPISDQSRTLSSSTPTAQELPTQLEQSDARSSNKVGKLWQTYGCL